MQAKISDVRATWEMTKRDFKIRYLGSVIGSYWNIIHPLFMILIYTLIFSQVMHSRLGTHAGRYSYSLYLCSGLLAWNLFSEIINRGTLVLLSNADFIKKLSFRPVILFVSTYLTALSNFAISLAIFLVFLIPLHPPTILQFLGFLLASMLFALFALSISVALGCMNIFLRDVQQAVILLFQLWFWFTPIIYLHDVLPPIAKTLLYFNPAFPFIETMHKFLYFHESPEGSFWLLMLAWNVIAFLGARFVYKLTISRIRDSL